MWKLESSSTLWSFLTSSTWKNQKIRDSECYDNSKFSQAEKFQPLPRRQLNSRQFCILIKCLLSKKILNCVNHELDHE